MLTRCLVCATPFPPNELLEHLPNGVRIAYDAGRGRLWGICRHCQRWSLVPIEARWEALDELEKIVSDRARLLSQTENIALLRAGELEIVRVGRARLAEEAWWRYGRELTTRRDRFRKLSFAGTAAVGAAVLGGWMTGAFGMLGAWWLWENAPRKVPDTARWLRFGSKAWRGQSRCAECGALVEDITFKERAKVLMIPGEQPGDVTVVRRCAACRGGPESGIRLRGADAERVARRILAYHHYAGASEKRVAQATKVIENAGSADRFTRDALGSGRRLGDLPRTYTIGLEIAANEVLEQRLLQLELAELEAVWKREEELAAIVDGELTPLPLLESLRRRITGQTADGAPIPRFT
jgi:hypothetical protein